MWSICAESHHGLSSMKFQWNLMEHCCQEICYFGHFQLFLIKKVAKVEKISYFSDVHHGYTSADQVLAQTNKVSVQLTTYFLLKNLPKNDFYIYFGELLIDLVLIYNNWDTSTTIWYYLWLVAMIEKHVVKLHKNWQKKFRRNWPKTARFCHI